MIENNVQMTQEQQREMARLSVLRDKYLQDYDTVGQHVAKYFTGTFDEDGEKIYKSKGVYTGMFPQLVLRKKWKDTTKYNPDGTMKDAELEKYRQEYLNGR